MLLKQKIEVSVVMAVQNEEKFLEQSLSSILENRFERYELIIVDDASNDKTLSIIKQFKEKFENIKLIRNKKPQGLASSLNSALSEAKADLILRMDGDDIMESDRILKQVTFMNDNPNIDIMGSNVAFIDKNNVEIGVSDFPLSDAEIKLKLKRDNALAHPSVIFRKNKIERVGRYDETFKRSQDYELWRRCLVHGLNFANSSEKLVKYRYSNNKSIANSFAQFKSCQKIALKHKDLVFSIRAVITLFKNSLLGLGVYRERSVRK